MITDPASAPMNKKRNKNKNNSKDQRRSKDTKWVRPKGHYCRYERERGGEDKRICTRIKALLTLLNDTYELRSATWKTHDLVPGMPRRQSFAATRTARTSRT